MYKKAKERGRLEDIIGRVFHELNANSKSAGQFFTPPQIATLTGTLTHKDIKDKIRKNGFFTIRDDCCGSGSLLIGVANTLFNMGYNPQEHLFIFAKDTDKRCVNMCYVQLSLYGIAGIVKHEDCLKGISFNKMITPPAIINHWELKLKRT